MKTVKPCSVRYFTSEFCGAQVEDVVLHDPGRHDQHRLGPHRLVSRGVLDQFDQPVAVDHLAGRAATSRPGTNASAPAGLPARALALPVLDEGCCMPASRFMPARSETVLLQHVRIRQQEIRRREHVEHLARGELNQVLVLRVTPRTPVVALCHHCWFSRNP
jgi:hypothetical protein